MGLELLRSTSASNSVFRVVCGEMVLSDKQNLHNEAVFGHVREGVLGISIDDQSIVLEKDDLYFISPNRKYRFFDNENASVEVISLNFSNAAAMSQDYIPQSIIRALINGNCSSFAKISPSESSYAFILGAFADVKNAESEKPEYFQLLVYSKMYGMFYELFSNKYIKILDVEMRSKKYRALLRVTHYIDEHYNEGVSLEEVAEATGISRYYVSHLFKELMDNTFVGYVNELRLNHAAMLLVTTDSPIIEIASKSGALRRAVWHGAFFGFLTRFFVPKMPPAFRRFCTNCPPRINRFLKKQKLIKKQRENILPKAIAFGIIIMFIYMFK